MPAGPKLYSRWRSHGELIGTVLERLVGQASTAAASGKRAHTLQKVAA